MVLIVRRVASAPTRNAPARTLSVAAGPFAYAMSSHACRTLRRFSILVVGPSSRIACSRPSRCDSAEPGIDTGRANSGHQWGDVRRRDDVLGYPLQANNIGQREYAALIKQAGVRRIKLHGLRHTCATLLLQAGQPVHVVAERLGHSKVSMTLEVYAHVLPTMQEQAAAAMGGILNG